MYHQYVKESEPLETSIGNIERKKKIKINCCNSLVFNFFFIHGRTQYISKVPAGNISAMRPRFRFDCLVYAAQLPSRKKKKNLSIGVHKSSKKYKKKRHYNKT